MRQGASALYALGIAAIMSQNLQVLEIDNPIYRGEPEPKKPPLNLPRVGPVIDTTRKGKRAKRRKKSG